MDLLSKLLKEMINTGASDLFLSTGSVPAFRINGKLRPVNIPPLASGRTEQMAQLIMQKDQLATFDEDPEANIGCTIPGIGRFRFNVFKQRNEIAMVVRAVPSSVPDFETLGIPSMLRDIVMMKRGLVLVVGPSGAGKSTTLASMIDTAITMILATSLPLKIPSNMLSSTNGPSSINVNWELIPTHITRP